VDRSKFQKGLEAEVSTDHLIGHLDIESLLEDLGIDLSYRKGDQLMCHCPNLADNHKNGDANPSFGFSEKKLKFNCFVCGGGTAIDLVEMMKPGMTKLEALKYLETFADFDISEEALLSRVHRIMNNEDEEPKEMPDYPPDMLFQYRKIHPFLYERGFTRDVIVDMQVGFDEEHMGITIPHFFMGKLVGLQRRHLLHDGTSYHCPRCELDGGRADKYKNTTRFPKVNTLYGYDQMKQALKEEKGRSVIVVESPFTVLKLKSLGFHRVVASFGSFSKEQGMLLIAVPTVYFWPDNDHAGWENAHKAINFLSKFVELKIIPAVPGSGSDGGDLTRSEEVQAYLDAAYPAALFGLKSPIGDNNYGYAKIRCG